MRRLFRSETISTGSVRFVRALAMAGVLLVLLSAAACFTYGGVHENQWKSRDQIWLSEASQVKRYPSRAKSCLRHHRSSENHPGGRVGVSGSRVLPLRCSMKRWASSLLKFDDYESSRLRDVYHLYRDDGLLATHAAVPELGPFYHHCGNLVRLTVTVRPRGTTQLVVRASAQYYLKAVESPEPYQQFFAPSEQALFIQANMLQ